MSKIGEVGEISSKGREGPSLRLKAPHTTYTYMILGTIANRPGSLHDVEVQTLAASVFVSLASYRRFLLSLLSFEALSFVGRAPSPPRQQQQQQQPLQLQLQ